MLRSAGHSVLLPDLTGLGDRSHLLHRNVSLEHYVDDVVNAVCYAYYSQAIFVGHSFSGLVATAAAARLRNTAVGLMYVDALIPEPGRSFKDMAGPAFSTVLAAHVHDGWLVRPWPMSAFGIVEPQMIKDFAPRLTSTPLAAFTAPYTFALPDADLPKAFIRCTRNANPLIAAQAAKAEILGFDSVEIDSGHAPMVTEPRLLASALLECASKMPAASPGESSIEYYNERLLRIPSARTGESSRSAP